MSNHTDKNKKPDEQGNPGQNLLTFTVSVNTKVVQVQINENNPVSTLIKKALKSAGADDSDISTWSLKWEDGNIALDPEVKVENYNIPNGAELFLSKNIGIGG